MRLAQRSKVPAVLALVLCAGLVAAPASAQQSAGGSSGGDSVSLPDTLSLTGVVRDFKARDNQGHADFQRPPTAGFGHYVGMVANDLDEDGKPAFAGGGFKVSSNWRDAAGRNRIENKPYIASRSGDANGAKASSAGGALTTADNFRQWFRDIPGVNQSKQLTLTLQRVPNTNTYTFNDRNDSRYSTLGGFFPVNGELFGNYSTTGKNFHFTFELETEFIYERGTGQVFTFTGDDDVWVFIDNKLVIDLGGVHGAISQSIELDRLSWLDNGRSYKLKFFFAERHTTQSNFRIDTTLRLRSVDPPATSGQYD